MKRIYFIFLLAIFLTSCATGTAVPTVTATTAAIPTLMPPTKVPATPTPVDTATALPPTEVPIPVITKSELENFDWNTSWGKPISFQRFQELSKEVPVEDIIVNDTVRPIELANTGVYPGAYGAKAIDIRSRIGENFFPQHAVSVDIVAGQPHHIIMCKAIVRGSDGHNILVSLNLSFDVTDPSYEQEMQRNIRTIESHNGVLLTVLTSDTYIETLHDPFFDQLVGGDLARNNVQKGILDEQTDSILLWISQIRSFSFGN
jgi:hypothetical protein